MSNARTDRSVVQIMDGDKLLESNVPLPAHGREFLDVLLRFLEEAWSVPDCWHACPDHDLFLRAVPIYSSHGDICFEIGDSRPPDEACKFVYERIRGILAVQGAHAFERASNRGSDYGGQRAVAFALAVVAAIEQAPIDSENRHQARHTKRLEPERVPRGTTLGHLAHRIIDHWFAPRAKGWHWLKRGSFTFAGGMTFFVFWSAYIVGATEGLKSPDIESVSLDFLGISVAGSIWFAGLTAWKDLSYGPARLFLSGFLLPYLVWTLVAIMYARPFPDWTIAPDSVNSPAREEVQSPALQFPDESR